MDDSPLLEWKSYGLSHTGIQKKERFSTAGGRIQSTERLYFRWSDYGKISEVPQQMT